MCTFLLATKLRTTPTGWVLVHGNFIIGQRAHNLRRQRGVRIKREHEKRERSTAKVWKREEYFHQQGKVRQGADFNSQPYWIIYRLWKFINTVFVCESRAEWPWPGVQCRVSGTKDTHWVKRCFNTLVGCQKLRFFCLLCLLLAPLIVFQVGNVVKNSTWSKPLAYSYKQFKVFLMDFWRKRLFF